MNNKTKAAVASGAAATALAASVALAPAASADSQCGAGKQMWQGQCETVTVTTEVYSGKPAPGSGGLLLRDAQANPTGSGMFESATFTTTGNAMRANGIDYIEVVQDKKPFTTGYGSLYKGYVTADFAQLNK